MSRGGARNRSGPQPDPGSARSDARGLKFRVLPVEGYSGKVPAFPIPSLMTDDERPKVDPVSKREKVLWREAWRSPQAVVWAVESWRWPVLAEMCRLQATVELNPSRSAALVGQLHRHRDQLGLTPAGLRENGWQIGGVEGVSSSEPVRSSRPSGGSRDRVLRVAT